MDDRADDVRPVVNLSIDVPDLAAGIAFYERAFGFTETARPLQSMAVVDANNVVVCIHEKHAGTQSSADGGARDYARHWTPVHMDLHVSDYAATLDRLRAAGGRVEHEFASGGPRPVAFCSDPFGNGLCVLGPRHA